MGDFERQRQARLVLLSLDGIDGLAGNLEAFRQIGLGPVARGPEETQFVFQRYRLQAKAKPTR